MSYPRNISTLILSLILALATGCQGPLEPAGVEQSSSAVSFSDLPMVYKCGGLTITEQFTCRPPANGYKRCTGWIHAATMPIFVHTDVYAPTTKGKYPLLLVQAGGGHTKDADPVQRVAGLFTPQGYVVVSFTARGLNKDEWVGLQKVRSCSTGHINLVDPDLEGEDLKEVILWVKQNVTASSQFGVKADVLRTGIMGDSYGGLQAWVGGAMKQPSSPSGTDKFRIKAIAARATGVDLMPVTGAQMSPREHALNVTAHNCTLVRALGGPSIQKWYSWLDENQTQHQQELIDVATKRSVARLPCPLSNPQCDPLPVDLAVLMVHPWADGVFPVAESMSFFERIRVGKPAHMRRLILADFGHPSGYYTWHKADLEAGSGDNYETSYSYRTTRQLFRCHLQKDQKACQDPEYFVDATPITYAYPGTPNARYHVAKMPATHGKPYYLHRGLALGHLSATQPVLPALHRDLENRWPSKETPGKLSDLKAPVEQKMALVTEPFTRPVYLLGQARARLRVKTTAKEFALSVRVYDSDGVLGRRLITRGTYWFDRSTHDINDTVDVDVKLTPMAYRFEAGRRLRVEISNIDRYLDKGSSPLALIFGLCTQAKVVRTKIDEGKCIPKHISLWTMPSYVDSVQTVQMNKDDASYIQLPLFTDALGTTPL